MQREGITGLYAGLDSALFGISVTNFVYYYWYEWTRSGFEKAAITSGRASRKLTTIESMIAGAIAGSATVLLTNPIWVVNTRMTTRVRNKESDESLLPGGGKTPKAPTTIGTLLALIRNEGPLALFSGVVPALVLVINPILQYTIFEQLKQVLEKNKRITPTTAFLLGALGKLFATSITYPYITVKSRMHVAGRDGARESMANGMRKIYKEEGTVGFYKGLSFNCSEINSLMSIRYRTKGHTKCPHCSILVCLQRLAIRADHQASTKYCSQGQGLNGSRVHNKSADWDWIRCCMIEKVGVWGFSIGFGGSFLGKNETVCMMVLIVSRWTQRGF